MQMILRRFPLTLVCVILIWYLCLFSPPSVPEVEQIVGFDKLVHITMYLGTCGVFWVEYTRARLHWRRTPLLLTGVVAPILMSGAIELVQAYFTTYRSGDWLDFAANSAGVLLAWLGHISFLRYRRNKERR